LRKINLYITITFYTFFLFLLIDFILGEKFLKRIGFIYQEDLYRIKNYHYDYSLKENLNTKFANWGNNYYTLCTDSRGFKFDCIENEKKHYQIAFIGDSFTEGIGLPYENTFVGQFKIKTGLDVVNLGVASYSPSIFLKKIKYLINNNIISFDHLVVSIDLTDLEDDWSRQYDENINKTKKNHFSEKFNLKIFLARHFPITYLISKKVNWFIKLNVLKNLNVEHLDFSLNKASWSYIENYPKLNEKLELNINNMNQIYSFLKKNNIKFSILVYPHQASILFDKKDSLYKKIWKDYCKNKCYRFIDAFTIFFVELESSTKEKIMSKYFIKGDPHFNIYGNSVISKILMKEIF
tara:strand:+ start:376 stop:1428 length:1053 start_codon:yes stop_codon:yes gene_type:complete